MGVLSTLLNKGQQPEPEPEENTPIDQYFFVGNEIGENPVSEAMLVIGNVHAGDDAPGDDDWVWGVSKCNEVIEPPEDTDLHVCVYYEGDIISVGEKAFQSHLAWLFTPDEVAELDNRDQIEWSFPFPEELRGESMGPGVGRDGDDAEKLMLSLAV